MALSQFDNATLDDLAYRIEQGTVFEVASKGSVANTPARVTWLFRTGSKRVIVYDRTVITNGDEITYQAFKGPTVTNVGTPITPTNRAGSLGLTPSSRFYSAPTVSADGTPIPALYMPGANEPGHHGAGQFSREGQIRILDPMTDYLVTVTNEGDVVSASVQLYLMYAELEPTT